MVSVNSWMSKNLRNGTKRVLGGCKLAWPDLYMGNRLSSSFRAVLWCR